MLAAYIPHGRRSYPHVFALLCQVARLNFKYLCPSLSWMLAIVEFHGAHHVAIHIVVVLTPLALRATLLGHSKTGEQLL